MPCDPKSNCLLLKVADYVSSTFFRVKTPGQPREHASILLATILLSFFFPFHNIVLLVQPLVWTCSIYLYRHLTTGWMLLFCLLQYLITFITSWDFLSAALGSVLLGMLAQIPLFMLMVGLALITERFVYHRAPFTPVRYAYVAPLFIMGTHFILSMVSPYGVAGSPANAFMYQQASVWILMRVGGLHLVNYTMLVPCALAAHLMTLTANSPAWRKTMRHIFTFMGIWTLIFVLTGTTHSTALRKHDSDNQYFSFTGVVGHEAEPWVATVEPAYQLTRTACQLYSTVDTPALVMQRETMFSLEPSQKDAELQRYSDLAADNGVWLGISGYVCNSEGGCFSSDWSANDLSKNLFWLFDDQGALQMTYQKRKTALGMEQIQNGKEKPTVVETPFGKACVVICNDGAFPRIVSECGRRGADLLLSPAWDPKSLAGLETPSLMGRATENGLLFLRFVYDGRSMAMDGMGTTYADYTSLQDNQELTDGLVHMTLPTHMGRFSLYSWLCGWIEWICLAAAVAVIVLSIIKK
eukprot:gnl/Dysnectes_brevis/1294_a1450_2817.p1 GENE.gnl/Dysnectes_brevis/1294_a1450_2817~~gnl/Dysnectes_brevis/1294_a1450_2817.p1  ORF type:complete len:525 (-),score=158.16 gnl/Dysnectes_brevis/1294_a1450_2817:34-1608(-)